MTCLNEDIFPPLLFPSSQAELALLRFGEGGAPLLCLNVHVQRGRHCQLWSLHSAHITRHQMRSLARNASILTLQDSTLLGQYHPG